MNSRLRSSIVITVTCVWVTNFILAASVDSYNPSESVNAIFMGIVGGALAYGVKESRNDDKDKQ